MTKLEQAARQLVTNWDSGLTIHNELDALREALDHSGKANEMVGCAYCNNPLFAGTKCNNCGRVTLAEQSEPSQLADASLEPVVKIHKYNEFQTLGSLNLPIGTKLYATPARTKDLTDDEIAAIVREAALGSAINRDGSTSHRIAHAVIAADREKNK